MQSFPTFSSRALTLLSDIRTYGFQFTPNINVEIIGDEPDNRLLELAETCKAQYLVTGNTKDFTMTQHKGTKIVSPKEYFDLSLTFLRKL